MQAVYRGMCGRRRARAARLRALEEAERLLPQRFGMEWKKAESETQRCRVICDYMAGMTDKYANRMYSRFFLPNEGSVFDRL